MNHGVAVLLEVEALLTDRVVASTNSQKGELNASRTTRSARVARSSTRAAAPTPCNGAPGGRPARTVAVLCPTRLPIGGFERPRDYGNAPCTYLLNLKPRGSPKHAGTVFPLIFGGTCRPWNLQTRARQPGSLLRAGEGLRLIGATSPRGGP